MDDSKGASSLKALCCMGGDSYKMEHWSSMDYQQELSHDEDSCRHLSWPVSSTVPTSSINLEKEVPCAPVQFQELPDTFELITS